MKAGKLRNTRWGPCPFCKAEGWDVVGQQPSGLHNHDRPQGGRCHRAEAQGPTKRAQVGVAASATAAEPATTVSIMLEPIDASMGRRSVQLVEERPDAWLGYPMTWTAAMRDTRGYLVFPKYAWRKVGEPALDRGPPSGDCPVSAKR
jgi:hypothetical protein